MINLVVPFVDSAEVEAKTAASSEASCIRALAVTWDLPHTCP